MWRPIRECILIWTGEPLLPAAASHVHVQPHPSYSVDQYLVSGNHSGSVSIWDTRQTANEEHLLNTSLSFQAHKDCVNGVGYALLPSVLSLVLFPPLVFIQHYPCWLPVLARENSH